jgi:mannitol/fructose-specific phosphotransferase system IIA component (Ntr-type)
MSFVARLRPELIRVEPPWRTFAETVEGLLTVLADGRVLSAASVPAATAAIAAREAEASTALLDIRVGVPHARLPGLVDAAVTLAVSRHGLYEAVPTVRIQIVALVLSPPPAVSDHLSVLAGISTVLRSAELRAALLAARDGNEAIAVLQEHDRATP